MHVIFQPYGDYYCVDRFLSDLRAQKHLLTFTSADGTEKKQLYMSAQLRLLPFGFYEYVFPKEDLDAVLHTLIGTRDKENEGNDYYYGLEDYKILGMSPFNILRKILRCQPIPEYKKDNKLLWFRENVAVQVIGIREDKQIIQPDGALKGWSCEAI